MMTKDSYNYGSNVPDLSEVDFTDVSYEANGYVDIEPFYGKIVTKKVIDYFLPILHDQCKAHDTSHVRRVIINAINTMTNIEHDEFDIDVVLAAALFHDSGRGRGHDDIHHEISAHVAASIFVIKDNPFKFTEEQQATVFNAILSHRRSGTIPPNSVEAKILRDADYLDGFGATGIQRCITYSNSKGIPHFDQGEMPKVIYDGISASSVNHIIEKYIYPDIMSQFNTDFGRMQACRRIKLMKDYVRLYVCENCNSHVWDHLIKGL